MFNSSKINVIKTEYEAGFRGDWHDHSMAQLIYPSHGVMKLTTERGLYIVPPLRGCWLLANEAHCVETSSYLSMHSVYCEGEPLLRALPKAPTLIDVPSLLRELILWHCANENRASNHATVFLGEQLIEACKTSYPALHIPSLSGTKLQKIEEKLLQNPANKTSQSIWAKTLGMSERTLARTFLKHIGMGFVAYRSQIRLIKSIEMLAEGSSVTATAYDLGYVSPSAFIEAFKNATGTTPGNYFKAST